MPYSTLLVVVYDATVCCAPNTIHSIPLAPRNLVVVVLETRGYRPQLPEEVRPQAVPFMGGLSLG